MTFAQNGQEQIYIEMLKMRIQGVFLEVPQSRQNATECGRERVVRSKSTRANQLISFIVSDSRVQARSHKISIEQWDDLTLI